MVNQSSPFLQHNQEGVYCKYINLFVLQHMAPEPAWQAAGAGEEGGSEQILSAGRRKRSAKAQGQPALPAAGSWSPGPIQGALANGGSASTAYCHLPASRTLNRGWVLGKMPGFLSAHVEIVENGSVATPNSPDQRVWW